MLLHLILSVVFRTKNIVKSFQKSSLNSFQISHKCFHWQGFAGLPEMLFTAISPAWLQYLSVFGRSALCKDLWEPCKLFYNSCKRLLVGKKYIKIYHYSTYYNIPIISKTNKIGTGTINFIKYIYIFLQNHI